MTSGLGGTGKSAMERGGIWHPSVSPSEVSTGGLVHPKSPDRDQGVEMLSRRGPPCFFSNRC